MHGMRLSAANHRARVAHANGKVFIGSSSVWRKRVAERMRLGEPVPTRFVRERRPFPEVTDCRARKFTRCRVDAGRGGREGTGGWPSDRRCRGRNHRFDRGTKCMNSAASPAASAVRANRYAAPGGGRAKTGATMRFPLILIRPGHVAGREFSAAPVCSRILHGWPQFDANRGVGATPVPFGPRALEG